MREFISVLRRSRGDSSGTTSIEYALIASAIAMGIVVVVGLVGAEVLNDFESVAGAF